MNNNGGHDDDNQILSKIGKKLYLNSEKADVYFLFESTERVPAHKILLSSASDVFEAMFYGSLKEEKDIKIVDVSAEAFKDFLKFFYFNNVELNIENVAEVMYLGKKYHVEDCLRLGTNLLKINITADNVVAALSLALAYSQTQLQVSCEREIRSNSKGILQSPNFSSCDRQVLKHIINMDPIACYATEIFELCMAWVRFTSKQEKLTKDVIQMHLGDLFYQIPFGSMSMDEFVKILPSYGTLFTADEYNEILQVISRLEAKPKLFKKCRRLPIWDEKNVIQCNRLIEYAIPIYCNIQSEEVTTFSTNTELLLGHFFCARIRGNSENLHKVVKVRATIRADKNTIETQFDFDCLVFDDKWPNDEIMIRLPEPLIIKPGILYEIQLLFPSTKYQAWKNRLSSTVNLEHNIVVKFGNQRKAIKGKRAGNVGTISMLGFNLLK